LVLRADIVWIHIDQSIRDVIPVDGLRKWLDSAVEKLWAQRATFDSNNTVNKLFRIKYHPIDKSRTIKSCRQQ
jgi:hypothetical protein